jgi:hypothetical protein
MFVFLYPENILQPSLRNLQTPAFQELVNTTQSGREITLNEVKQAADNYSRYFKDICTLEVQASCLYGEGGNDFFYMFGIGETGTIYWSVYNINDKTGYAQTLWLPIEGDNGSQIKEWNNVVEIIGAIPYRPTYDQGYIFLFGRRLIGISYSLVYAKYDLRNKTWINEAKVLNLSIPGSYDPIYNPIQIVVKQRDFDEPPHLAFWVNDSSGLRFYERKLNLKGDDWEDGGFRNFGPQSANQKMLGMIADHENYIYIFRSGGVNLIIDVYTYVSIPNFTTRLFLSRSWELPGIYGGAFSHPGTNDLFILTNISGTTQLLNFNRDTGFGGSVSPFTGNTSNIAVAIPTSGRESLSLDSPRYLVYKTFNDRGLQTYIARITNSADPTSIYFSEPSFLAKPFVKDSGDISIFNIPIQLNTEAQRRKVEIQEAYQNSLAGLEVNLTYLQEAFYYVPIQLAIALQRSGEYLAALDLFQTVYDYTAEEGIRKIYYGLIREESFELTYERSRDWLLDPLDPHLIAATRQNIYTHFTLFAIIRCLLEFADSEFTQDTSESTGRARSLYLTAQELLESKRVFEK